MEKVLMLHGPNHNMFGHRDKNLYGTATYEDINEALKKTANELGVEIEIFQSNDAGKFMDKVHEAFYNDIDAVIVNPGGWTNYHVEIKDALDILKCPLIEVHMSNTFKKHGGIVHGDTSMIASGVLIGMGVRVYTLGLRAAVEMIRDKKNAQ